MLEKVGKVRYNIRAGYGLRENKMKKGFTLIELLIVVLIIGVLTAVALPQYQKAVDKSRYATLMPVATAVRNAQESFYMASAQYSPDLQSLDIHLPGTVSGAKADMGGGISVEVTADGESEFVSVQKEGLDNKYVMYFARSQNFPKEIHCEALTESERANQLCLGLGGEEVGANGAYTAYVLEGSGDGKFNNGGNSGSGSKYNSWYDKYNRVNENCSWSSSGTCGYKSEDGDATLIVQDQGSMYKYMIKVDGKEVYYARYTREGYLYETISYNEATGLYEYTKYSVNDNGGSYTTTLYEKNTGWGAVSGNKGVKETGTVSRGENGNWVLSNGTEVTASTNCSANTRKYQSYCK